MRKKTRKTRKLARRRVGRSVIGYHKRRDQDQFEVYRRDIDNFIRAYNNAFASNDSNHRYTIEPAVQNGMLALGWKDEGIVFCAVE